MGKGDIRGETFDAYPTLWRNNDSRIVLGATRHEKIIRNGNPGQRCDRLAFPASRSLLPVLLNKPVITIIIRSSSTFPASPSLLPVLLSILVK
jgi:hypothetical protein